MKSWLSCLIGIAMFAVCGLGTAVAQTHSRAGTVVVPPTSVVRPQDLGRRAHTNFLIFVPAAKNGRKPTPQASSGPSGETPSSLACVYQIGAFSSNDFSGCPYSYKNDMNYDNPDGGSNVIAIVDAYDYPTAASDFITFSNTFGLPSGQGCGANRNEDCFTKVSATSSFPSADCGWAQEAALDIEWAHAMAPYAQIILVEAASNSFSDLLQAVQVASQKVASLGGGQVSMSWGGSEFRGEAANDIYFTTPKVTYFASSGDSGGKVIWPSASPNVISAGGTSVNRDSNGNFLSESVWSSAGGGASRNEPVPSYQSDIYTLSQLLGNQRGTPDISFDADPYTGVSIYDSYSCQGYSGWQVFGGTSVSSPSLAGIFNLAGAFSGGWGSNTSASGVQSNLYQSYDTASNGGQACSYGQSNPTSDPFYDVTTGKAAKYTATGCWDFASGIGTVRGVSGLVAGSSTPSFSLSASPTSVTVTQGQSTSSTITVSPVNGYTGTVSLSVGTSCPTGATCSFSPSSSVSFASNTSPQPVTLNINTGSATANTYTLSVTGTDSSDTTMTSSATVSLTVTSATSGGGSVTILASPSSATVSQNSTTPISSVTLGTGTSGFTGNVNLSVSGLPPQSSASFSSSSINPTTSATLTVTTGRHTPTKTYVLTISGTGPSGTTIQPATVTLTVQ